MRRAHADVPCQPLLAEAFDAEPKTRRHSADNPAQYERFREAAREHETDESEETRLSARFGQLLTLRDKPLQSERATDIDISS